MIEDKSFCFIICSNNELWLNEAIHYIENLHVPESYNIDLKIIKEADSIVEGYSEALINSNAKYKVYLHQDVFIINKYFLDDIISIFESDIRIGMIGMYGYSNISRDGIMWHGKGVGKLYKSKPDYAYIERDEYRYNLQDDGLIDVAEIDGFMMVTQYDIPWKEMNSAKWHFYDACQSVEFWKAGYRVVIPNQRYPWCIHDDSKILNLYGYNKARKEFIDNYKDFLGKNVSCLKELRM